MIKEMTESLASEIRRVQANFRAAWERHRFDENAATRLALEKARRELDEVQRVAVHAMDEVHDVVRR